MVRWSKWYFTISLICGNILLPQAATVAQAETPKGTLITIEATVTYTSEGAETVQVATASIHLVVISPLSRELKKPIYVCTPFRRAICDRETKQVIGYSYDHLPDGLRVRCLDEKNEVREGWRLNDGRVLCDNQEIIFPRDWEN